MDAERDTDGTMDAHEGDHTPADGAGTEGEGGKPDTRPGDRLATIRRTLWWIGLALQLPFALTLIHFDTPYLILGVSYALFRQDWQATRHQSSAFPHLKRNGVENSWH